MIKKLLGSIQRKKQRRLISDRTKRIFDQILASPIEGNDISCIHQIDLKNAGDLYAGPYHYFDQLNSKTSILQYLDPSLEDQEAFISSLSQNNLIIGGGGLLNRPAFSDVMSLLEAMSKKGKKMVIWGAGHNEATTKRTMPAKYSIDLSDFALVGTRDKSMPGEYVPCVSCLHPLFDSEYTSQRELGIVFHKKTLERPEITRQFHGIPSLANSASIDEIIPFIGGCESIITDSYHAMYWGLLLEKRVTVVPNSSKFFDFHISPAFSNFEQCIEDSKKAVSYSGTLDECRSINKNFYQKALNALS